MFVVVASAFAAVPEEVSIRAMDDYGGSSTEVGASGSDWVTAGYKEMSKELGAAIANKPMVPGETLGTYGFHVGIATTVGFLKTGKQDGTNPSGWDLADPQEDPVPVIFIPQVQVRKGLPASLELGANFGWIGMSQTGVVGVFGRWGILEGYKPLPDVSLQVGYAGYVGNDELEVGVVDLSATVGYTLPFGNTPGIHSASFSPFVGIGLNEIHAAPRGDLSRTGLDGRIPEVNGIDSKDPNFDESFAPIVVDGGFRILNGSFSATVSGSYAPSILPTVNVGFGFTY